MIVIVIAAIGRTGGICATESRKHVGLSVYFPCFLQMQKLNGNRKIKDLKVWRQELVHLVKQKLAEWSNFPEAMVFELLECYDVSLQ